MKLYDFLCGKNNQSYANLVGHKFTRDLASGKLPWENFYFYLVQDHIFIDEYSLIIKNLLSKASKIEDKELIKEFVDDALNAEADTFAELVPQEVLWKTRRSLATLAYIGYLYEIIVTGDFLDLLVALAPCPLSYDEIASRLGQADPLAHDVYKKWIQFYQADKTRASVNKMRQAINSYDSDQIEAVKLKKLERIFSYIVNLEIKFFDQAYLHEEC